MERAAAILGLGDGNYAAEPMPKSLMHKDGVKKLSKADHSVFRQVVGLLMHIQEDMRQVQFAMMQLSHELQSPTDVSMVRLKHMV